MTTADDMAEYAAASERECCMLGCHSQVAETQMVPTVVDGEVVELAYPMCRRCTEKSREWTERSTRDTT